MEMKESQKIAIIGIGCRYPGNIDSASDFWELLCQGKDAIVEVPEERWSNSFYYTKNRDKKGKSVTKWGGFIDDYDKFDPTFFQISPREAKYLDPQQRILLEKSWEAFEDAGLKPEEYRGRNIGVFIGAFTLDYKIIQFCNGDLNTINTHTAVGSMMTMVSNRISYIFDFKGPSLSVDTACSSSLVAIHLACMSILNGESEMALAGGVLLNYAPQYTIAESHGGFLSADGRCKTYDAAANGYVRGEGVGVLLLKPLDQALKDGDPVYAVIRGTAVNQDGFSNGITVPNGEAQEVVILKAFQSSNLKPADVQYVEAHGTGTGVGDPIEANTLGKIFSQDRSPESPCYIGSVKSNIGHTESAAGVAGVIKAALCLKNRKIPPNLHFKNPNPKIKFDEYNIKVPTTLMDWPKGTEVARAAVNSFGFGGTNSHAILEEAPLKQTPDLKTAPNRMLFPVSARTPKAIQDYFRRFVRYLEQNPQVGLYDFGYNLTFKKSHHNFRTLLEAQNREELLDKLRLGSGADNLEDAGFRVYNAEENRKLVMVCAGMGPQWWGMGQQLLEEEPVFRRVVEQCDRIFSGYAGWSLLKEMTASEGESKMAQTDISQPANFALQAGLAALWESWGIIPDAIVGHSTGEVASLYLSGVYSLEDALKIVYHRSRLQHTLRGSGVMAALGVSHQQALEMIESYGDELAVAAVNSPGAVTIAGNEEALKKLEITALEKGLFFRFLRVEIPFHSAAMEPIKGELLDKLKDITPCKPRIPLYSTVTGGLVKEEKLDAGYWWLNVRQSVLFSDVVKSLLEDGYKYFLEISPHPVLTGSVNELLHAAGTEGQIFYSLRRLENEISQMYLNLGGLWGTGFSIDWKLFYPKETGFLTLPYYPWQKERYWAETEEAGCVRKGQIEHPLLGHRVNQAQLIWEGEIDCEQESWLKDHCIQGNIIFPAAGYIDMVYEALHIGLGQGFYSLEKLDISKALFLDEKENSHVQLSIHESSTEFSIGTWAGSTKDSLAVLSSGVIRQHQDKSRRYRIDPQSLRNRFHRMLEGSDCYSRLHGMGFEYKSDFQGLKEIYGAGNEVFAKIELSNSVKENQKRFVMHPALIDLCFQAFITLDFFHDGELPVKDGEIRLPVFLDSVTLYRQTDGEMWVHVVKTCEDEKITSGNINLYDKEGFLLARFDGFTVMSMDSVRTKINLNTIDKSIYQLDWVEHENVKIEEKIEAAQAAGKWIILEDELGLGNALKEKLVQSGGEVLSLYHKRHAGANSHTVISYNTIEDFQSAVSDFCGDADLKGVLFLWNLDIPSQEEASVKIIDQVKNIGLFSLVTLIKALGILDKKCRIWAVTNRAQPVAGKEECVNFLQAPIWGMARLIANQEHVMLWGGVIDVDDPQSPETADCVLREILFSDGQDQIGFRNSKRYVPQLNHIPDLTRPLVPVFRNDCSYLITGAFGSLGELTVRWMISRGARRFILTTRSHIPERDAWPYIEKGDKNYERVRFLLEIEKQDVFCQTPVLDVTDENSLVTYLEYYEKEEFPPIKGVINIAGIVEDQLIMNMEEEVFDKVFKPKTYGSWLLHKYFKDHDLDFFIIYSSIAATVTSSGQANYASANAFIDSLIQYRRSLGLTGLSLGWGPWAVGMIKELQLEKLYRQKGMELIDPDAGMQVLERLFYQNIPYAAVVSADWKRVVDSGPRSPVPYLDHLTHTQGEEVTVSDAEKLEAFLAAYSSSEGEERQDLIKENLKQVLARVLHSSSSTVDEDVSFNALGIDSMMAIELKNRIELNLGVVISVVDILSGYSVKKLGLKVEEVLNEKTGNQSSEEVIAAADETELDIALDALDGMTEEEAARLLEELQK